MRISLVVVSSLNGRITKGRSSDIYRWTSKEDQAFFFDLVSKSRLIVMGSATYEAVRKQLKLTGSCLRIVLTKNPQRYATEAKPGILEFSSVKAQKLIKQLEDRGYKKLLLVGGGEANRAFLESDLVNELLITIEPRLFGSGTPMIAEGRFNAQLKLVSIKKLNKQGTLLCKYTVLKHTK